MTGLPARPAIGQPLRRKEDARLLTGRGRFSDAFLLGVFATLLAASLMQTAVAAEHHRATRADRAPVSASQQKASNQVAVSSPAEANREYWRARGLSFGGPSALRF